MCQEIKDKKWQFSDIMNGLGMLPFYLVQCASKIESLLNKTVHLQNSFCQIYQSKLNSMYYLVVMKGAEFHEL